MKLSVNSISAYLQAWALAHPEINVVAFYALMVLAYTFAIITYPFNLIRNWAQK